MDKARLKQVIKEAIQDQGDLGRRDLSYKSPQLQKVLDFIRNCEDEIDLAMIYAELKPKMDKKEKPPASSGKMKAYSGPGGGLTNVKPRPIKKPK